MRIKTTDRSVASGPLTRSETMRRVRSQGNRSTEGLLLEKLVAARIKGWRRHYRTTGKPDFAFPKKKIAIFLDKILARASPTAANA